MAKEIKDNSKEFFREMNQRLVQKLTESAIVVEASAKRNLEENKSVITGHLRRMIGRRIDSVNLVAHIGTNVHYAPHVEFGTRPHKIRVKNATMLRWEGGPWGVTEVNHPGSKAKPYLRPALANNLSRIKRIFNTQ